MAVVHEVAGRVDGARADLVDPLLGVALPPQHDVAFALGDDEDGAGPVPVEMAAAPHRELLDMAAVGGVRQGEAHDAHALALHGEVVQRELVDVRDEVGLPATGGQPRVGAEVVVLVAEAVLEHERVAEEEILVVEHVEQARTGGGGHQPHRLRPGDVEVLVGSVQRDGKGGPGAPLEGLARHPFLPHRCRPLAVGHVDDGLEQVPLRQGLLTRRDLAHVGVGVLLVGHVEVAPMRAHARPGLQLHLHDVSDMVAREHRDPFPLHEPVVGGGAEVDPFPVGLHSHPTLASNALSCDRRTDKHRPLH